MTGLSLCISQRDRSRALSTSFNSFNHTNEQVHDEEVRAGADCALCRLLSFLILKETFEAEERAVPAGGVSVPTASRVTYEIAGVCQVIELIYRCSKEIMEVSFNQVGRDYLRLFCRVSSLALVYYQGQDESQVDSNEFNIKASNTILTAVTKTLSHFARAPSKTIAMANHPRLLPLFVTFIRPSSSGIPFEARRNTLWILANMACCTENMQPMAFHDDHALLDALIATTNVDFGAVNDSSEMRISQELLQSILLQYSAFRCLLNLTWNEGNKILLTERQDLVESIISTLSILPNRVEGEADAESFNTVLRTARRFAIGTLRNLANTPPRQKVLLCSYQERIILNVLCDATEDDRDTVLRDKAFAVIFNLISSDTANDIIAHPRLLDVLVDAASATTSDTGTESSSSMSLRSLQSLELLLSEDIPESSHQRLRQALDQVSVARRLTEIRVDGPPGR